MNLEKRTVRNKVWWIAGAILLPLLLFLALGAQDQVVSYSVFKVPAVSAYYFIYYAEKWFGVFHLFLTAAAILVAIVIAVRISDRSIYESALLRIFLETASVWLCYLAVVSNESQRQRPRHKAAVLQHQLIVTTEFFQ